jgi:hypothetical protein
LQRAIRHHKVAVNTQRAERLCPSLG